MSEQIMNTELLGEYIITTFHAQRVRIKERDSILIVEPMNVHPSIEWLLENADDERPADDWLDEPRGREVW